VNDRQSALEGRVVFAQPHLTAQLIAEVQVLLPEQPAQHYGVKVNPETGVLRLYEVPTAWNGRLVLGPVCEASACEGWNGGLGIPERFDPKCDVEHWFGAKTRDRCAADVFEDRGRERKEGADLLRDLQELLWPRVLVFKQNQL
jgi:hypothetical protein